MIIPTEVSTLLHFFMHMLEYLIPCILGSTVSYFIKNKTTSGKKKRTSAQKVALTVFTGAIIPCVIVVIIDHIFSSKGLGGDLLMGLAVLIGAIGEDVTRFLLNIKNILILIKTLSKGVDEFKEIAEVIERMEENDDDDKKD